ncbi:MAG: hypothetical protein QOF71_984 [Candidatus Eremiobacteraeota bacterium]|nr:hypothetical protein [Candidatus Eremiobacteraeota bacterium]
MTHSVQAEPRTRAGILLWKITAWLAATVAAGVLILRIVSPAAAAWLWQQYSGMPHGGEAKEALTLSASIAVVIWSGALIAFQIKRVSIELRGALLLLEYAFIGPLLALFTTGAVIRTLALVAVLYCSGRAIRHAIFFLADRAASQALEPAPHVLNFPSVYVGICAVGSLAVLFYPVQVTVAWASLGGVVGGLNLVILTLERKGAPESVSGD